MNKITYTKLIILFAIIVGIFSTTYYYSKFFKNDNIFIPIENNTISKVSFNNLTKIDTDSNFLIDASYLIIKFFQGIVFTQELNKIKQLNENAKTKRLFQNLIEYNNLLKKENETKEILPIKFLEIKKFLSITKDSKFLIEKERLYKIIIEEIHLLIDFFDNKNTEN